MKRSAWKWLFGISIGVLVLLILLTFGSWALFNIVGAIFLALMGNREINAVSFADFMSNFVGSPMFYIYLADVTLLCGSVVVLVITRKK